MRRGGVGERRPTGASRFCSTPRSRHGSAGASTTKRKGKGIEDTQIRSDLSYIDQRYGHATGYLRVGGRPVLFVYADGNERAQVAPGGRKRTRTPGSSSS